MNNISSRIMMTIIVIFVLVFGFNLGVAQEEKIDKESIKITEEMLMEEKEKEIEKKKAVEPKEIETKKIEEIKKQEIAEPKEMKKIEKIKPLEKERASEDKKAKSVERLEERPKAKEERTIKEKEAKEITKVVKPSIPAKISFLAGSVKVKRAKTNKWVNAKLNMILNSSDEICTGFDSQGVITLNSEDKVTIKANTHIVLSLLEKDEKEDSWAATLKIWLGEVRSHIKGLKERRGQYHIETVSAVAGIRGTDFIVIVSIDKVTRVICAEGEVEVHDTVFMEKVVLNKNQITMVGLNKKPTLPRELTEEELMKFGIIEKRIEKKEAKKEEIAEKPAEVPEELKKKEKPAWRKNVNLAAEFGTEVVDGKLYQRVSFQPEFSIGKVGVSLDAFVLIDENNKIRKEDWDEFSDIIEKTIYVRYGQKKDPFYVKLGGLNGVTLGHGMIMNNYSNLINYPNERKKGIELGVDRKIYGIEGMVDSLRKVNIYGVRAYVRPLAGKEMAYLLNKLTVGGTFCLDRDPDETDNEDNKYVAIMGIDTELPLKEGKILSIILYADAAKIKSKTDKHGTGIAAPGLLIRIPLAIFKAEYRIMDSDFIPGYFNYLYEIERKTKESLLSSGKPEKRGYYAEFTSNILNIISMSANYEDYSYTNPNLSARIKLIKRIIPQLTLAEASYSQNNIEHLKLKTPNTYIEWKFGYSISGPVSLIYTYSLTYDKDLNPQRSMSITTRIDF
ncbi:MAG: FecR family protein [bacterium]|nr:FecR family protein [bacterium]